MDGWRVSNVPGTQEAYGGDWLLRAVVAKAGIYANTTEEAAYPFTREDASGATLDGSNNPVNAFWSATMYDGRTQLRIENLIDRYLINTPMLDRMRRNADGSLTIHIQKDDPGETLRANWLPAPHGPIYLVMRLCWPKPEAPSILPIGRGAWQPPGIQRVT